MRVSAENFIWHLRAINSSCDQKSLVQGGIARCDLTTHKNMQIMRNYNLYRYNVQQTWRAAHDMTRIKKKVVADRTQHVHLRIRSTKSDNPSKSYFPSILPALPLPRTKFHIYCSHSNPPAMALRCCIASPKDAPRIASIHTAAFQSNTMLLAQFRSTASRQALTHIIEQKTLAEIRDSNTTVLTVKRSGASRNICEKESSHDVDAMSADGEIIAFAKWAHPNPIAQEEDQEEEVSWIWPEGTAVDVLDGWTKVVEEAQVAAMGSQACYRKLPNIV